MRRARAHQQKVLVGALAFLALALLGEPSAQAAQVITICKRTTPPGGAGFPFIWGSGSSGPLTPFTLNDGQCQNFDVTTLDKFNRFTETVPAGWSLTNITCNYTTSAVRILGANPDPAFQPGDNMVAIDLNEANVTCTFHNERAAVAEPPMDVYAVKFLCGSFLPEFLREAEWPVKPGNYLTAINVHNPNRSTISFRKKGVLLYRADKPPSPEEPMPPGDLMPVKLDPDYGVEIDCGEIRNKLLGGATSSPTFIKGWVVFEVSGNTADPDPLQLDVTAVYTSHGWDQSSGKPVWVGFAEDVEQVLPKRVK
jgi:hypothetical protein